MSTSTRSQSTPGQSLPPPLMPGGRTQGTEPHLAAFCNSWHAPAFPRINAFEHLALRESTLGSSRASSKNTVTYTLVLSLIRYPTTNTKTGDVVRIAPNELVFLKPQAAKGQFTRL